MRSEAKPRLAKREGDDDDDDAYFMMSESISNEDEFKDAVAFRRR